MFDINILSMSLDKRTIYVMKDSNESSEVTEERMIYHLSKDFIDVIGKPVKFFT